MSVAKAKQKPATSAGPHVNPALAPFLVDVGELHLDPNNARRHPPKNLQAIADILVDVGQQTTIVVDPQGKIIKGNGTYRAAVEILGWKKIAAVVFDGDARKARRYGVGDNRAGELAEWEFQVLAGIARDEIAAGGTLAGWDAHELEPLLRAEWAPPQSNIDKEGHQPGASLTFSAEQWAVVQRAIAKVGIKDRVDAVVEVCKRFAKR